MAASLQQGVARLTAASARPCGRVLDVRRALLLHRHGLGRPRGDESRYANRDHDVSRLHRDGRGMPRPGRQGRGLGRPSKRIWTHLGRDTFPDSAVGGGSSWFCALTLIPLAQVFAYESRRPLGGGARAVRSGRAHDARPGRCRVLGFIGVLIVARPGYMAFNLGAGVMLLGAIESPARCSARRSWRRPRADHHHLLHGGASRSP